MKICVVGLGYVGSVLAPALASAGHQVVAVDSVAEKVSGFLNQNLSIYEPGISELVSQCIHAGTLTASCSLESSVKDIELAFVCVGTPMGPNGRLELGQVKQVCARLAAAWRDSSGNKVIAIRSTVDPGTCEQIQNSISEFLDENNLRVNISIVYIPEFLREGTALSDYTNPPFLLIGLISDSDPELKNLLQDIFTNVSCTPSFHDIRSAEVMKYVCNTWHALKVVFANEIGIFCEALSINSLEVMSIFKRDTFLNISDAYLTPGGPYGGSCLPKDVSGLVSLARAHNLSLDMLSSISNSNQKACDALFSSLLQKSGGRPLLIYGLSFKSGTDDIRNSPAYALAQQLTYLKYPYAWFDHEIVTVMQRHNITSSFSMLLESSIKQQMTTEPLQYIINNNAVTVFGKDIHNSFQRELRERNLEWYSLTVPSLLR